GNGGGLKPFKIISKTEVPDPFCAPADAALAWALAGPTGARVDRNLSRLVLERTEETDLEHIAEEIKHETYTDILRSDWLRNEFAIRNTDMDHLAGVTPTDVRGYGGPDEVSSGDEIDTVLAVAFANLEFR